MFKKLVCILFLIFVSCGSQTHDFNGSDITQANLNSNLVLKSQSGEILDSKSLQGNVLAVFFGFTHCPDICPTTLGELKQVKLLLKRPEKFKVLFVSVDPERDTVENLKDYIPQFGENIFGLTGSPEEIKKVADQYKVFYQKVSQGSDYTIDHSAGVYLIDTNGKVRVRHPYGSDIEKIAEDINNLF